MLTTTNNRRMVFIMPSVLPLSRLIPAGIARQSRRGIDFAALTSLESKAFVDDPPVLDAVLYGRDAYSSEPALLVALFGCLVDDAPVIDRARAGIDRPGDPWGSTRRNIDAVRRRWQT